MKILKIEKEQIQNETKSIPINYNSYLSWLDDNNPSLFYGVSFQIISDEEYKIAFKCHGIFEKERFSPMFALLRQMRYDKFLLLHEYVVSEWFPDHIISSNNYAETKKRLMEAMVGSDLSSFIGGFIIENEVESLIEVLFDYPYALSYKDINLFSYETNLVIQINHHLDFNFISTDKKLLESISLDEGGKVKNTFF